MKESTFEEECRLRRKEISDLRERARRVAGDEFLRLIHDQIHTDDADERAIFRLAISSWNKALYEERLLTTLVGHRKEFEAKFGADDVGMSR
jgi:hypothetical protein